MARKEQLFGTDGIRDVAGEGKLRPDRVVRLGEALATVAREAGRRVPRVLLGRDTRASGPMLEAALSAGLMNRGARPESGGVLPTPAVAHVVRKDRYDLGVVLSASHNPYRDNGIKVFGRDARKLSDDLEARVEALALAAPDGAASTMPAPAVAGSAEESYLDEVLGALDPAPDLRGLRIVVDCANGAAHHTAPEALRRLGADVVPIHASPDGKNINRRCGALHPAVVGRAVKRHGAHVGLALDGDADRAMLADESGRVQDGDTVLFVLARDLLARRRLPHRTVVGTVMTNVGLESAFRADGIRLVRTPVGDRHVAKAMQTEGFALGGEPSGHVLLRRGRRPLIGDGLATALLVLRVLRERDRTLGDMARDLERAPQVLINIRVRRKPDLLRLAPVRRAATEVETAMGDRGRILLRYSGTEPLARVMVEGPRARDHAEHIATAVRAAIGVHETDRKEES
jgi:phosphoglucosamine mutase